MRTITLIPPRLTPDAIAEQITCIRAHRERIFQLSASFENGKILCHNFGQGGAGWTFLFGCVHRSIALFEQLPEWPSLKTAPIVVLGAGCYGLLTAILLARKGYQVRIIAKERNNLPSHRAAGFFFPGRRRRSNEQEIALFTQLGLDSYQSYLQIMQGEHPFIAQGPKLMPAYYGLEIAPGFEPYIAQGLVNEPELVCIDFGNDKQYNMAAYELLFINPAEIMQEFECEVQRIGIPFTQQEINTFDEIDEKIIFNCTGLGSKTLIPESRIIPVQGHLITLQHQPPMEQLQYLINAQVQLRDEKPEFVYYAPKNEGILGITFLRGKKAKEKNEHEFERLLERARYFFGT